MGIKLISFFWIGPRSAGIFRIFYGPWDGMDWINVAQDGDKWRDFVNTVMNIQVP
jgi:hypothetical protein